VRADKRRKGYERSRGRTRVMIVGRHELSRRASGAGVKTAGYDVKWFITGHDTMAAVRANAPDLVILDV
jgi:DNA-binding response OmpR family regulator